MILARASLKMPQKHKFTLCALFPKVFLKLSGKFEFWIFAPKFEPQINENHNNCEFEFFQKTKMENVRGITFQIWISIWNAWIMDCKKPVAEAIPRLKQQMMKLQVHVPAEAEGAGIEGKLEQNSECRTFAFWKTVPLIITCLYLYFNFQNHPERRSFL